MSITSAYQVYRTEENKYVSELIPFPKKDKNQGN